MAEGIPVRKSGIRIGEVAAIAFDDRPHQPDGVLVTLSLDRKYKIKEGSVPRLSRSLIGDVTIDLLPGTGPGLIATSTNAAHAADHRRDRRARSRQGADRRDRGLREGRRDPGLDRPGRQGHRRDDPRRRRTSAT